MSVAIVDYGSGNLHSAAKAFERAARDSGTGMAKFTPTIPTCTLLTKSRAVSPSRRDVRQAAGIFRAAIKEMDRRYDLFAKLGTRNIDGDRKSVV